MIDFRTFEAVEGEKPHLLLDRHPDGSYLVVQVDIRDIAAAIWSTKTKRLVWTPEDACALSWSQGERSLSLSRLRSMKTYGQTIAVPSTPGPRVNALHNVS